MSIDVAGKFALAIYSDFRALSFECARVQNNWHIYKCSTPVEYYLVSVNVGTFSHQRSE